MLIALNRRTPIFMHQCAARRMDICTTAWVAVDRTSWRDDVPVAVERALRRDDVGRGAAFAVWSDVLPIHTARCGVGQPRSMGANAAPLRLRRDTTARQRGSPSIGPCGTTTWVGAQHLPLWRGTATLDGCKCCAPTNAAISVGTTGAAARQCGSPSIGPRGATTWDTIDRPCGATAWAAIDRPPPHDDVGRAQHLPVWSDVLPIHTARCGVGQPRSMGANAAPLRLRRDTTARQRGSPSIGPCGATTWVGAQHLPSGFFLEGTATIDGRKCCAPTNAAISVGTHRRPPTIDLRGATRWAAIDRTLRRDDVGRAQHLPVWSDALPLHTARCGAGRPRSMGANAAPYECDAGHGECGGRRRDGIRRWPGRSVERPHGG